MTTVELKQQIQQAVDELAEDKLKEVLTYVNSLNTKPPVISAGQQKIVDKIITENYNLLKRLAQ